jgi:hypothetical protein
MTFSIMGCLLFPAVYLGGKEQVHRVLLGKKWISLGNHKIFAGYRVHLGKIPFGRKEIISARGYRIKLWGRVHLCKHLPMALLVPAPLQESIALHILGMLRPVPSPVIPVLLHPALLTFLLVLAVVRVRLHLLALPAPFPQTLALFLAAIPLVLYAGIADKGPAAFRVGTSDLLAHGSPCKVKTITLFRTHLSREEEESDRKNPKKMSLKIYGKTGRISMWVFPNRPTIGTFSPSKMVNFLDGGDRNFPDFSGEA